MPRTPASLCTSPATSSAASVVTAPVTHWTSGLKSPTRASTSQRSTSAKISPSNPYPRSRNPNPSLNQPQFPQPNLQPPRQTGPRSNRHRQFSPIPKLVRSSFSTFAQDRVKRLRYDLSPDRWENCKAPGTSCSTNVPKCCKKRRFPRLGKAKKELLNWLLTHLTHHSQYEAD